jgi:preprotein translocase subunit SecD
MLGLQNVEYLVQQYQLDKLAKLEQEDLIKQQQVIQQQRQMNEINSRIKGTVGDFFKDFKPQEAKVNSSVNMSSTKKMLNKKAKTEKLEDGTEKRKINYNIKGDESDGASDSQPSDDNLDQDEILKLIPKKFGKSKYLRGEEEKKKKKVPKTEQKPKKP